MKIKYAVVENIKTRDMYVCKNGYLGVDGRWHIGDWEVVGNRHHVQDPANLDKSVWWVRKEFEVDSAS